MASIKTGKWFKPLGVTLLALLAGLAWYRLAPPGALSTGEMSSAASRTPDQVYLGPPNSIAVLPFADASGGKQQAYWPTGLSAELQDLLTRVPDLVVTSRNSSFFFRDSSTPLSLAAERLQVSRILSGEADVSEGRIRLRARLYDARTRREIWSEVYQGELAEIFGMLDRILASVADAVNAGRAKSLPRAEPVNLAAWEWRLRGMYLREQRTAEGYLEAEAAFRAALDVDPGYERARVGLAGVLLARSAAGKEDFALLDEARRLLETSLRNQPESPHALGLLSYLRHNRDWDWQGALEAAESAVNLNPGDPELMSIASLAMFSFGQFDRAGELLRAAVRQDPLNLGRRFRLGLLQEFSGDYDAALSSYRQVIGLNPEFPGAHAFRARVKILQDKAESAMKESGQEVEPFWKLYSEALAFAAQENREKASGLLDQLILKHGHHAAYQVAELLAFQGESERAFEWLDRAIEQRDGGMGELIGNRFFAQLHADPRWEELLRRMALPLDLAN